MKIFEWAPGTNAYTLFDLDHVQAIRRIKQYQAGERVEVKLMFNPTALLLSFPPTPEQQQLSDVATQYNNDWSNPQRAIDIERVLAGRTYEQFAVDSNKYNDHLVEQLIELWKNK